MRASSFVKAIQPTFLTIHQDQTCKTVNFSVAKAMAEQMYRRGEGGIMEPIVPQARSKAHAFDSWLSKGGNPGKVTGKFKSGPMRGMTYDQAKQKFETMWERAPGAIKDKYAARDDAAMSPSEKKATAPPAARPLTAPEQQKKRMASYGFEMDAKGNPVKIGSKPATPPPAANPAGSTFEDLTKAPVAPAGGVKSVGNGASEATGWKPSVLATSLAGKSPDEQRAALMEDAKEAPAQRAATPAEEAGEYGSAVKPQAPAPPAVKPAQSFPNSGTGGMFPRSFPNDVGVRQAENDRAVQERDAKARREMDMQRAKDEADTDAARAKAGLPVVNRQASPPPATITPPPAASPAAGKPTPAAPSRVTNTPTSYEQGGTTGVTAVPGDAPGKPTIKPPAAMPTGEAPTGAPVTNTPGKGINRLTGLPFGYQPGDKQGTGANAPAMNPALAAQSVARQQAATPPPVAPPRATLAPAADRYAQAQSDYQKDLDPAKAKEMDKVYAGSSSLDQAKITAQSLKRAADPTLGAPKARVVTAGAPRARIVPPAARPVLAR